MDRRNFLRTASSFALLAAGTTTGVSRVFAEPSSSWTGNPSDKNTPNTDDTMEYRSEDWMYRLSVWDACRWWVITVGSTTKRI